MRELDLQDSVGSHQIDWLEPMFQSLDNCRKQRALKLHTQPTIVQTESEGELDDKEGSSSYFPSSPVSGITVRFASFSWAWSTEPPISVI